jgi:hypothetical protein
VATATLLRQVLKLKTALDLKTPRPCPLLEVIRRDPAQIPALAGKEPDPWQAAALRSTSRRLLMLASRQAGKSLTAAALAIRTALLDPGLVLLLSPSQRQSGELFKDKVLPLYNGLGRPVAVTQESALQMALANGSRIISLPGDEATVRCYSGVKLIVIDEAARVPDSLYYAVRPMLAVSRGILVALSTPFGKRGWFFEAWEGRGKARDAWRRVEVKATDCPRITAEFLAEEEAAMGLRWFRQEYFCSFEDTIDAVFRWEDIQAMMTDDVRPLFPEGRDAN